MANYNKSFNFRNGFQVDDDNFLINPNGLVGIGSTIPTQILDVNGNIRATGFITATSLVAPNLAISGVSTLSTLNVGITSITSGIITASSGIVTYYGDGSKLLNIPTTVWTSVTNGIYSLNNVGIATTNPQFNFQVGPNPLIYPDGISIDLTGNVYSQGIVTATNFVGDGSNLSTLNASNIASGTLNNSRLPSNLNISGTVTAYSFSGFGTDITGINASNISTGTLSNSRLPSNLNVTSSVTSPSFIGDLTGTATTATNLSSTGTVTAGSIISGFSSVGISTVSDTLYVAGKIGVGTQVPVADIDVRRSGISSIRVISDNNIATIGIGRSAEVRTGNTNTFYPYSQSNALDIINSNTGNLNSYLDYGAPGLGTGNFNWIYGQNPSNPLMTLTYDGKLGLGITNPPSKLYVVGNSYVTGVSTVAQNLVVGNNLTVNNDSTFNGNVVINGTLSGNVGITTLARLGINTSTILSNSYDFFVGGDPVYGPGVAINGSGTILSSGKLTTKDLVVNNNLSVTGISTIGSVKISSGIVTNATYYGDATNLNNLTGAGIGTYGDSVTIPQIQVDSNGRIINISTISVSGAFASGKGVDVYRNGVSNYVGFASGINFNDNFTITNLNPATGIATLSVANSPYATVAGVATYASTAGIATYATTAGVSTNVIGGIGSVTQLSVSGITTTSTLNVGSGGTVITTNSGGLVGIGTTNPKGILDLVSTTQPFYLPRMTTAQRDAIVNVTQGALIFNITTSEFEGYTGIEWVTLGV